MSKSEKSIEKLGEELQKALRMQCLQDSMPMDRGFLCSSVSLLDPPEPISVREDASLDNVMRILQDNKIGCVIVINELGELAGIFSERDYVLKIYEKGITDANLVSEFMTREPVSIALDETIAFALTLMSQGGFRHLPIVDDANIPVGMVSIKNIVDYLSNEIFESLMSVG